eukprot:TRINITY_DN5755_c0_g1_i6.p4 TRINITY_DN5755_c0_g1~~TRINITY_DN5755_c0_g1_i6.p4  ORF type:complete len:269 (+),score=43.79 TRINITY_DN5755_c0_g1_i6:777-1583(+)
MALPGYALLLLCLPSSSAGKLALPTTDCDSSAAGGARKTCEDAGAQCLDRDKNRNGKDWVCVCPWDSNGRNIGVQGPPSTPSGRCDTDAPLPAKQCTVVADCNGNADSAAVDAAGTGCDCACSTGFFGIDCASGCTVATHCNGNADSVAVNAGGTGCDCTCSLGFSGVDCAAGGCSVMADCNGNADSVAVKGTGCECTCKSGWEGAACDACSPGFFGTNCENKCDVAQHCNGNAGSVAVNGNGDGCDCTCSPGFYGDDCAKQCNELRK